MKSQIHQILKAILVVTLFSTTLTGKGQYTLQDDDVVVENGVIMECSYDYQSGREIIIPEILDGQTVTEIADHESGIFKNKKITSLQLPSTLERIGNRAFFDNRMDTLVIPSSVKYIGVHAFSEAYTIVHLDLSNCTALETIDQYAFYDCEIDSLNMSNCTSLSSIGTKAFNDNSLTSLILPASITTIGNLAFSTNFLPGIDLSGCTSLTTIGDHAFNGNVLTSFVLPVPDRPGYDFNNWEMGGSTYAGGTTVSSFATKYTAQFNATGYEITFTISDGTDPIAGATVDLGVYGKKTSSIGGEVIFSSVDAASDISYTISAYGYSDTTSTITVVDAAVSEAVVLNQTPTYNVNLTVTDGTDPIEGASVVLVDYTTEVTDASGLVSFSGILPKEDLAYIVSAESYITQQGTVDLADADISETVTLGLIPYSVSFLVTDGTGLIAGATISLEGYDTRTTNASGIAVFEEVIPEISIPFTVDASGYFTSSGTVTVLNSDLTRDVTLAEYVAYEVSFVVSDGTNLISGATVSLTGYDSQVTDNDGNVNFTDVTPEADISYTVEAAGFVTSTGTITVDNGDVEQNISLDINTGSFDLQAHQLVVYPNPAQNYLQVNTNADALISIISLEGKVILQHLIHTGNCTIDLPAGLRGVYVLKIDTQDDIYIEKLMVE
jgi:hypothetical protein